MVILPEAFIKGYTFFGTKTANMFK